MQFHDIREDNNDQSTPSEVSDGCVILELTNKASAETRSWLMTKLRLSRSKGGAELILRLLKEDCSITRFLLRMSKKRLLANAEQMGLRKQYCDGSIREFVLADIENFQGFEDTDSFLSPADRHRILLYTLEGMRARADDSCVPGASDETTLFEGEAIVPKCLHVGIIKQIYPLHDKLHLQRFAFNWYKRLQLTIPLDNIEQYYGIKIALYYAFFAIYTKFLAVPAFVGAVIQLIDFNAVSYQVIFASINIVWLTLLLESWKRRSATLTYRWGTLGIEPFEETRAAHVGILMKNPVTGRLETHSSWTKRQVIVYFVSLPIVMLCLSLSVAVMFSYMHIQKQVDNRYSIGKNGLVDRLIPLGMSAAYSFVIVFLNAHYRRLALFLTRFENHQLQSSFDNHLITKLVLFTFVNSFLSLFYVAFYLQDMQRLRHELASQLITTQIIGQFQKVALPYIIHRWRKKLVFYRYGLNSRTLTLSPEVLAEVESEKDVYTGTKEDYLELTLQFGYVFLFSSVFPISAFCALVHNFFEIRLDAFKLCWVYQRPFPKPASDIGVWQAVFEILSVMAIGVNCALVYLSPAGQSYVIVYGATPVLLVMVAIEHFFIGLKYVIAYIIPDLPGWIEKELAHRQYELKEQLKRELAKESSTHLRRLFREHTD